MNRYSRYHIAPVILILLTACQPMQREKHSIPKDTTGAGPADSTQTSPVSDTTIVLKNITRSRYQGPDLDDSIAKKILYRHFKQLGYLTEDDLPDIAHITEADNRKLSVDYTTIFKTDINHSGRTDAVITYWLTPPHASGHCWQPYKAIIADTDTGYSISNEAFIPDNYAIDSVKNIDGAVIIFGYDYDCGNGRMVRRLRIKLVR